MFKKFLARSTNSIYFLSAFCNSEIDCGSIILNLFFGRIWSGPEETFALEKARQLFQLPPNCPGISKTVKSLMLVWNVDGHRDKTPEHGEKSVGLLSDGISYWELKSKSVLMRLRADMYVCLCWLCRELPGGNKNKNLCYQEADTVTMVLLEGRTDYYWPIFKFRHLYDLLKEWQFPFLVLYVREPNLINGRSLM